MKTNNKKKSSSYPNLTFDVDKLYRKEVKQLPWLHPITEWKEFGIKHLDIKRGMGRHVVIFIQVGENNYVIKELGYDVARREVDNYKRMLAKGIHTLIPVGCVSREEEPLQVQTQIGEQYERNIFGHSVTLLVDRVLPDSQLYRRALSHYHRSSWSFWWKSLSLTARDLTSCYNDSCGLRGDVSCALRYCGG